MNSVLNPTIHDLEQAAVSAGRGATQIEREMGANVLFVAAIQSRETGNVLACELVKLRAEVARLRALENSMRSVLQEAETMPAAQTSAPAPAAPRLQLVRPEGA